MLQQATFVGDRYDPPSYLAERYAEASATGRPTRTGLYTDANGTFISGLGPIRRDDGSLAGILHVDHDVDEYLEAVQQRSLTLAGLALFLGLTVVLGGGFTYVWLNRRVAALLQGTAAIRNEDYGHRVPLEGSDELAVLAAALNDTIPRLRERFEMLKFLPKHTQAMIEESSQVDLQVASRRHVAVLESDIRGFSTLSEHLSPEATIAMLNRYVRVQAEVIVEHDGSIDKYMGDAVLAVFEGDDRCRRALDAALAIQVAVEQLNASAGGDTPVRIGVGVSEGEVVMGNMGSEQRMEHTVIGAVVNLAARLCSAAGAGEVVAQVSVARAAGRTEAADVVSVKGFEQPIDVVRLTA
jgi:class 3 adenylate cyclase